MVFIGWKKRICVKPAQVVGVHKDYLQLMRDDKTFEELGVTRQLEAQRDLILRRFEDFGVISKFESRTLRGIEKVLQAQKHNVKQSFIDSTT